jgi:hypothetical protein
MNYEDVSVQVRPEWIPVRKSRLAAEHTLTEDGLRTFLAQLLGALQALHRENRLYARVSPEDVFIDQQGVARIGPVSASPLNDGGDGQALDNKPGPGFAAFEQYASDPAWPLGPWTDIYGVCALARTLILKQSPPDAVQRMVADTLEPLQDMALPGYSSGLLSAIDRGMSLLPTLRFSSVELFAERLGLRLEEQAREQHAVEAATKPVESPVRGRAPALAAINEGERKKAPVWMMVFVLALLVALGGWLLLDKVDEASIAAAPAQESDAAPVSASEAAPSSGDTASREVEQPVEPSPDSELESAPALDLSDLEGVEPISPDLPPASGAEGGVAAIVSPAVPSELTEEQQAQSGPEPIAEELAMAEEVVMTEEAAVNEEVAMTEDAASQPQAQEPPAPAIAKQVTVQLSIKPWGEIFINGSSRGVSPPIRTLSLEPGQYQVRVANGDLPPHQQQLTVRAGEPASITHSFE